MPGSEVMYAADEALVVIRTDLTKIGASSPAPRRLASPGRGSWPRGSRRPSPARAPGTGAGPPSGPRARVAGSPGPRRPEGAEGEAGERHHKHHQDNTRARRPLGPPPEH